jgi:tape measure domain-containing protein
LTVDIETIGVGFETEGLSRGRRALNEVEQAAHKAADAADKVGNSSEGASRKMSALDSAARMAAGALKTASVLYLAREYVQMADAVSQVESRLRLVTSSSSALAGVQKDLYQIAQQSRVNYVELAGTYSAIARSANELGISQNRILGVTKTISQALTISGASASAANAALIQLSQGLASGTLRGEELNSVMEQTPRLAQAIAQGMGVSIGELRKLGAEGKITGEAVMLALEQSASSVESEFKRVTPTVSNSITEMTNALTNMVGQMDKATGSSGILAKGISEASKGIDSLAEVISRNHGTFRSFMATIMGVYGLPARIAVMANTEANSVQGLGRELEVINRRLAEAQRLSEMGVGSLGPGGTAKDRVAALKAERDRLQMAFADASTAGLDTRSEDARLAARTAEQAASAKAAASANAQLAEIRQKLSGVDKEYLETLTKLDNLRGKGLIEEPEYIKMVSDLAAQTYKKSDAYKSANKAAKDHQDQLDRQRKLVLELSGLNGDFIKDWEELNQLHKSGGLTMEQLVAAQKKLLEQQPGIKKGLEDEEKARKAANKAIEEAREANNKVIQSHEQLMLKLKEEIEKQKEYNDKIGLTKEQLVALDIAKLHKTATDLEHQAGIELELKGNEQLYKQYMDQAAKLRELAQLKASGAVKDVATEAAKKADEDWQKTAENIEKNVFEALLRGFESGKSVAENFRDVIKNMFNSLVLQPIIKPVMSMASNMLSQAFGMMGGGSTAGFMSFLGDNKMLMNLASMFPGGKEFMLSAASGLFGGSAAFTTAGGGSVLASEAAAMYGVEAGAGTGVGALGAAAPFAAILAPIFAAWADGMFDGETRKGGQMAWDPVTGKAKFHSMASGDMGEGKSQFEAATAATATAIQSLMDKLGTGFKLTGFHAGLEMGSEKGRGGVFSGGVMRDKNGNVMSFGESGTGTNYGRDNSNPNKSLYEIWSSQISDVTPEQFTTDLKQSLLESLQVMANMAPNIVSRDVTTSEKTFTGDVGDVYEDVTRTVWERVFDPMKQELENLPKVIRDKLRGVDVEKLTTEQVDKLVGDITKMVDSVYGLDQALKVLPFEKLTALSFDAKYALTEFAGGVEKLVTNLGTYYTEYYTQEEQRLQLSKNIANRLGAAGFGYSAADIMGSNREAFRWTVEQFEGRTDEEGMKMYAALLEVAGAFATLHPAVDKTGDAAKDAAKDLDELSEKLKSATDQAYETLMSVVDRERSIWEAIASAAQERVGELTDLLDLLNEATRSIYGGMPQTAKMQGQQGLDFIRQAVSTAKTTGYMPDREKLSEAIEAANGMQDMSNYASRVDYERDRLRLADQLKTLADIAGPQLTAAEQELKNAEDMLKYLDDQVALAKAQLDALRGLDTTGMTIQQAITKFYEAWAAEKSGGKSSGGSGTSAPSGTSSSPFTTGGSSAPSQSREDYIKEQFMAIDWSTDAGGTAQMVKMIWQMGLTAEDVAKVYHWFTADELREHVRSRGFNIPGFRHGGLGMGGLAMVGEDGPELVRLPTNGRVHNKQDTAELLRNMGTGGNDYQLSQLNNRVEKLDRAMVAVATQTEKTASFLERCFDAEGYLKVKEQA